MQVDLRAIITTVSSHANWTLIQQILSHQEYVFSSFFCVCATTSASFVYIFIPVSLITKFIIWSFHVLLWNAILWPLPRLEVWGWRHAGNIQPLQELIAVEVNTFQFLKSEKRRIWENLPRPTVTMVNQ